MPFARVVFASLLVGCLLAVVFSSPAGAQMAPDYPTGGSRPESGDIVSRTSPGQATGSNLGMTVARARLGAYVYRWISPLVWRATGVLPPSAVKRHGFMSWIVR